MQQQWKGGESRQGKGFDSQSPGFCHRLEILDFKAKCQRATRSQGIFFGKCQNAGVPEGNVSVPPSPEPPRCWQCHPRGWGRAGGGREGGRTKPPSLHPQRFHGSFLNPHYWKNNPKPFSTCQGGRGAAVSGKFRGISLVLLLLLFNSQGHGI